MKDTYQYEQIGNIYIYTCKTNVAILILKIQTMLHDIFDACLQALSSYWKEQFASYTTIYYTASDQEQFFVVKIPDLWWWKRWVLPKRPTKYWVFKALGSSVPFYYRRFLGVLLNKTMGEAMRHGHWCLGGADAKFHAFDWNRCYFYQEDRVFGSA